jgi:hypothetical protein
MKLIIAGSRTIEWEDAYSSIVESCRLYSSPYYNTLINATEIISGMAKGVDEAGEYYAYTYDIGIKRFPADWNKHGKAAGPIRNKQMAEYADALLLIWDGQSRGSANMKKEMQKLKKPIYEVILRTENV